MSEHDASSPAFDNSERSLAELAKQYGNLPVIANGRLADAEKAAQLIDRGQADIISLGKGALANHDWVRRVSTGVTHQAFDAIRVLHPNAKLKAFELNR